MRLPREHLEDIRQVHLNAVLFQIYTCNHVVKHACLLEFRDSVKVQGQLAKGCMVGRILR